MAQISWGKPRIFAKKNAEGQSWFELATPVQDSTTLETTKGDKTEAKIEGGQVEDVRYARSTYALNLAIRALKGRTKPFTDDDGVVTDEYSIVLQPEDAAVDGFYMKLAHVSCEDTWTSADGGQWVYTFDALKSDEANSKQLEWGVVAVTGSGSSVTAITFKGSAI